MNLFRVTSAHPDLIEAQLEVLVRDVVFLLLLLMHALLQVRRCTDECTLLCSCSSSLRRRLRRGEHGPQDPLALI
eukprot:10415629-Heterocapsa_arctica.AAC.1